MIRANPAYSKKLEIKFKGTKYFRRRIMKSGKRSKQATST